MQVRLTRRGGAARSHDGTRARSTPGGRGSGSSRARGRGLASRLEHSGCPGASAATAVASSPASRPRTCNSLCERACLRRCGYKCGYRCGYRCDLKVWLQMQLHGGTRDSLPAAWGGGLQRWVTTVGYKVVQRWLQLAWEVFAQQHDGLGPARHNQCAPQVDGDPGAGRHIPMGRVPAVISQPRRDTMSTAISEIISGRTATAAQTSTRGGRGSF